MHLLSNAKINLGLSILNRREDGFHNIESLFLPVPWNDEIELSTSAKTAMMLSGIEVDSEDSDNLCMKAYHLLKDQFDLPPVSIKLQKNIPIGAGLGGGSSNAAVVLKGLNQLFELNISLPNLMKYADQLGSDCSFFIENRPAFVSGKGELIDSQIEFSLNTYAVLVYPNLSISTKEAYGKIVPQQPEKSIRELIQEPPHSWQNILINNFEDPLLKSYGRLRDLKEQLKSMGAFYVSMSGSGSSFFAFFDQKPTSVKFNREYPHRIFKLAF